MADCIFCKIVAGTEECSPARLAAPSFKKHFDNLNDASSDSALLGEIVAQSAAVAKKLGITDFRLVANTGKEAGQLVNHLHFHLLAGRRMTWPPG